MATERHQQYARIESVYGSIPPSVSTTAPSSPTAPRTLRHKVSRAFSTLTRRDPTSPERERGPILPLPTPAALSPTSTSSTSTSTQMEMEKPVQKQSQNALKRTWGRSVAIARARSEPALRAKRAKAAALALAPPAPPVPAGHSRSAPAAVTTHSRDVNAYVPSEGAVVSYTYPLWRIDPVLVGCFVCL